MNISMLIDGKFNISSGKVVSDMQDLWSICVINKDTSISFVFDNYENYLKFIGGFNGEACLPAVGTA